MLSIGRFNDPEKLVRRLFKAREHKASHTLFQAAFLLRLLGHGKKEAGRRGEEDAFFKIGLEVGEAKTESDNLSITYMMYTLRWCAQHCGRPGDAEVFFKRVLAILEKNVGADY